MKTIKITQIFSNKGTLAVEGESLATAAEYQDADRCVGSIFEALEPGELVELAFPDSYQGCKLFELDKDLDLIESDAVWWERIDYEPGHVPRHGSNEDVSPCIARTSYSGIEGAAGLKDYFYEV